MPDQSIIAATVEVWQLAVTFGGAIVMTVGAVWKLVNTERAKTSGEIIVAVGNVERDFNNKVDNLVNSIDVLTATIDKMHDDNEAALEHKGEVRAKLAAHEGSINRLLDERR